MTKTRDQLLAEREAIDAQIAALDAEPDWLPCAHCGGVADPKGWLRGDGVTGPECESCGVTAPDKATWNQRAALPLAPRAVMGEAICADEPALCEVCHGGPCQAGEQA
jgi:hypothetical protein